MIPIKHQEFIKEIIELLKIDSRFECLLGAGSMINDEMDEHSDLDLILVVKKEEFPEIMLKRKEFAIKLNGYLSGFTGEHVGEPRLLICLYERNNENDQNDLLLHVDLKFITFDSMINELIEMPIVLWENNNNNLSIKDLIKNSNVKWPNKEPQWFEDRIWIWIHYCLTKIQRGEFFEAIGMLSWIRDQVLGPMSYRRVGGLNQRGVRKLELISEPISILLKTTIPSKIDKSSLLESCNNCITIYLNFRNDFPPNNIIKNMPSNLNKILNNNNNSI
ncbi:hypothetical protein ACTFIZ_009236 [Dictyostelium cf. discoideum]